MNRPFRTIQLTLSRVDRDLIRAHGYPFPGIQAALDAVPESSDVAVIPCDGYEVELLLGDLARSINDCRDGDLQERLDELYECIESEAARSATPTQRPPASHGGR